MHWKQPLIVHLTFFPHLIYWSPIFRWVTETWDISQGTKIVAPGTCPIVKMCQNCGLSYKITECVVYTIMHICLSSCSQNCCVILVQIKVCCLTAQSHYLNQCCHIVNCTWNNKLQWNYNQYIKVFIQIHLKMSSANFQPLHSSFSVSIMSFDRYYSLFIYITFHNVTKDEGVWYFINVYETDMNSML